MINSSHSKLCIIIIQKLISQDSSVIGRNSKEIIHQTTLSFPSLQIRVGMQCLDPHMMRGNCKRVWKEEGFSD